MSYNIFTTKISMWTDLGEDSSDSVSDTDGSLDEEAIITYYFNRGFDYSEILLFLVKHHDRTLASVSFLFPSTPLARLILLHLLPSLFSLYILFFTVFLSTFWSKDFRVLGVSTLGAGSAGNMKTKVPLINGYSSKRLWKCFTVLSSCAQPFYSLAEVEKKSS